MKNFNIILLCFLLSGCAFLNKKTETPQIPQVSLTKPNKLPVKFVVVSAGETIKEEGLFLDSTNSKNLLKNIDELEAYIEKLELLKK
jgi:hypothetical protein